MSTYLGTIALPPKTLTEEEQTALLTITGQRRGAFRDHMLFSLALGTGLREHELVALNIGDVRDPGGSIRRRVDLRVFKRSANEPGPQQVLLSEGLRTKLARFLDCKRRENHSLETDAPLFISRRGLRLSLRQVRHLFSVWQERAGFIRPYSFHSIRHSACSNLYNATKDIRLTQSFARHKSILTTMRYTHPNEADLVRAIQRLPC
jgi:site-specific recombinase XerC